MSYILNNPDKVNKYDIDKIVNIDTTIIDNLNIYYINPQDHIKRNEDMIYQFKTTNVDLNKVHRYNGSKFPKTADKILKQNLLSWNHINMWKLCLKNNDDGAIFFEDDIILLKNWKKILQKSFDIIGKDNIDIFRLDPFPLFRTDNNKYNNQILLMPTNSIWCCGGYYLSKNFIVTALNYIKCNEWKWATIEILIDDIKKKYFTNKSFETIPRICIQSWFLEHTSDVQDGNHVNTLKQIQYSGYLQEYIDKYNITNDMKDHYNKTKDIYINNKYLEKRI